MAFALAALVACGGGGGGGGSEADSPPPPGGGGGGGGDGPGGPSPGDGGGGGGVALEDGQTAALVELPLPDMQTFVLRATVPVPPGTYPRSDGQQPFGVRDVDGVVYGAQAEIVSRYPKDAEGADVVEVLAVVNRPPGAKAGDRATYEVVLAPHAPRPSPGSPGVEDLVNGPLGVPASVKTLLQDPDSIVVRSRDCFGNVYEARPLDATGSMRLMRYGEHAAELRVFDTLVPAPPKGGSSGTLPHFFSTHAYLQTRNGETVVGFDLRITNAHSGIDGSDPLDDPLDDLYFQDVEVLVPSGWAVVQDYDDPFLGTPYSEGAYNVYPIVEPNSGGKLHWIEWLGQFHRRLAICALDEQDRAREYLTGGGVAFARRGNDPVDGHEYWSWWNEFTGRWWPQSHVLPSLDHLGNQTENQLKSELQEARGFLEGGGGKGLYPYLSGVLGWAHPYGIEYGGMTGGAEINIFDGVRTVVAASRNGFQLHRIIHRMASDRQAFALYDGDGDPSTVEGWLVENGAKDYVPFEMFMVPIGSKDPFGLEDAPQFQIQHVEGTGKTPSYKGQLDKFDPHDYQHLIRYTRTPKVLVWLENDSLSKDDLWMSAENFRLGYHPHYNGSSGYAQSTGMRWDIDYVADRPGTGFPYGRGEAWGTDAVCAAYATGTDETRARLRPWFDTLSTLLDDGQASCSGFIQAVISNQFMEGKYRARQMIEQSITENTLRGMIECVYRREDPATQALLEDVLADSLYAAISTMAWFPGETGPWMKAAVGPKDLGLPVWCSWTEMPADSYVPYYDTFQNWTSFAYGYEHTGGDTVFFDYALLQVGGGDLLTKLEASGLDNLYNKAGLLALLQWLNGDI